VLATDAQAAEPRAHPVLRSAGFASDAACASCHEFSFPPAGTRKRTEWMQSTVQEHARSPHAETPCAGCHMPWTGAGDERHRSHAFAATRSPAALAAAIHVRVTRDKGEQGEDEARFALAPEGVGHALPTGDLFRRIALVVTAVDAHGAEVARSVEYLGRRFGAARTGSGVYETACIEDDRLTEPTEVSVPLPRAPHAVTPVTMRWRVVYQRIEHPNGQDESAALSGSDVILSEGSLR
jgi:hypothetical protein